MKLKKIKPDHYVIVDDSEIMEGDWVLTKEKSIHQVDYVDAYTKINGWEKITHSTQPLEQSYTLGSEQSYKFEIIKPLSLSEVKELIGEVDVEKKAEMLYPFAFGGIGNIDNYRKEHWIKGYAQALEDNKEKKYTEEDVIHIVEKSRITGLTAEYLLLSLQPPTEWEVEFVGGKLKLK